MISRMCRIAETWHGTDRAGLYRLIRHLRLGCADFQGENLAWAEKHLREQHYILAVGNPHALEREGGLAGHGIVVDGFVPGGSFRIKDPGSRITEVDREDLWMFLIRHERAYQYALWR
jgi:hypothetical protein